jgi:hypothetical protein
MLTPNPQIFSEKHTVNENSTVYVKKPTRSIFAHPNPQLQILQADKKNGWIVVSKPAFVHVSPNSHSEHDTLLNAVAANFPDVVLDTIGEGKLLVPAFVIMSQEGSMVESSTGSIMKLPGRSSLLSINSTGTLYEPRSKSIRSKRSIMPLSTEILNVVCHLVHY